MVIFFYFFAVMLTASSLGVIVNRNPIYSVLWLILAFCSAAGLFLLLGAEFIAMMLIVVYVGAVAVLFLFVVMMLDINLAEMRSSLRHEWPVITFFLLLFTGNLIAIIVFGLGQQPFIASPTVPITTLNNTEALGLVLYTKYILEFQIAGIILLVAMVGCIALTLRRRDGVRKQNIDEQNERSKENSLQVMKVSSRVGLKEISYE